MGEHPYMEYDAGEFIARWHGGEYIELGYMAESGFVAGDVINVWDHAKGEPRIPRTLDAFRARVDEWLAEQGDDES
jgi:hypothetical protein